MTPKEKAMKYFDDYFYSLVTHQGKTPYFGEKCREAIDIALEERDKEIISQLEDWNNNEGSKLHQCIEKLKTKANTRGHKR